MKILTVLIYFGALLTVYAHQFGTTGDQQTSQSAYVTDSFEESSESLSKFENGFYDNGDEDDESLSYGDTEDDDEHVSDEYTDDDYGEDVDFFYQDYGNTEGENMQSI